MFRYLVLFLLFLFSLEANGIGSAPAVVFASGNNKFVLPVVVKRFNLKYPKYKVFIQYGSTGDLAKSILEGVSYDIFLAADMQRAKSVYLANKAISPPEVYARGSLILFVPPDQTLKQKKITILKKKEIKHISIANCRTAPYGKAAIEALRNSGLYDEVSQKIQYSTDVSTAITNVIWYDNAGFLAKSSVKSLPTIYDKEGINWIEIDQSLYEPILQGYVVSENGSKNENAVKFIEFITSQEGQAIYKEYGYR
ncbi:MAG: molybdate ABC transporter substrate-binding protein [Sulfurimonas sp.]|nr:molybdate ABC transporter substrate-binding protein [Sulfurimonas sp.]